MLFMKTLESLEMAFIMRGSRSRNENLLPVENLRKTNFMICLSLTPFRVVETGDAEVRKFLKLIRLIAQIRRPVSSDGKTFVIVDILRSRLYLFLVTMLQIGCGDSNSYSVRTFDKTGLISSRHRTRHIKSTPQIDPSVNFIWSQTNWRKGVKGAVF